MQRLELECKLVSIGECCALNQHISFLQVRFDCGEAVEMSSGGVPPVLFCTGDGVLARTANEPGMVQTHSAHAHDLISKQEAVCAANG